METDQVGEVAPGWNQQNLLEYPASILGIITVWQLSSQQGEQLMNTITAKDGAQIVYKDWGKGQTMVFGHGWPLSSDEWDSQMLFFA